MATAYLIAILALKKQKPKEMLILKKWGLLQSIRHSQIMRKCTQIKNQVSLQVYALKVS